jgi:hypothetical protein
MDSRTIETLGIHPTGNIQGGFLKLIIRKNH